MDFTVVFLEAIYAQLQAVGNELETGELMLLGAVPDPGIAPEDLVVGDLDAPTFTGYANKAIAAFVLAYDAEGIPYLTATPSVFAPTNGTNLPQYIYGAAILDAAGLLAQVSVWAAPLQLAVPLQQLHVTSKVKIGGTTAGEIEGYVE